MSAHRIRVWPRPVARPPRRWLLASRIMAGVCKNCCPITCRRLFGRPPTTVGVPRMRSNASRSGGAGTTVSCGATPPENYTSRTSYWTNWSQSGSMDPGWKNVMVRYLHAHLNRFASNTQGVCRFLTHNIEVWSQVNNATRTWLQSSATNDVLSCLPRSIMIIRHLHLRHGFSGIKPIKWRGSTSTAKILLIRQFVKRRDYQLIQDLVAKGLFTLVRKGRSGVSI